MRVRKGVQGDRRCHWIQTSVTHQWELHDLVDGLCSHYIRYHVEEHDGPLPESLTAAQIVKITKEECGTYGTSAVWTWSEGYNVDSEAARAWARGVILRVFPELDVPV
jgi:hypothetical protein